MLTFHQQIQYSMVERTSIVVREVQRWLLLCYVDELKLYLKVPHLYFSLSIWAALSHIYTQDIALRESLFVNLRLTRHVRDRCQKLPVLVVPACSRTEEIDRVLWCIGQDCDEAITLGSELAPVLEVRRRRLARSVDRRLGERPRSGPQIVVEARSTGALVAHKCVEATVIVGSLCFLIHDLALLRDCEDLDAGSGRRDGLRHRAATRRFPSLPVIIGKREVKVVIRARVGCFADRPTDIEFVVLRGESVDIRVVVLALQVFSYIAPLSGRARVSMDVGVASARLTDAELH
jgi:hypothetical protein